MFQPAGVRTLMRMRSSEPTRPFTAQTRAVPGSDTSPRPLTAPPTAGCFGCEAVPAEGEEEEDSDNILESLSSTLYHLQNSWVEERRSAAAQLWQELHSLDARTDEEELGELEDVEKVRALDERAKQSKKCSAAEAEEVLSLVEGFRRATAMAGGDLRAGLAAAEAAEERRQANVESQMDILLPRDAGIPGAEAEAAAGPGTGLCHREQPEEIAANLLYEEASAELEAARKKRALLENSIQSSSWNKLDVEEVGGSHRILDASEDVRLAALRREVQQLQVREAWVHEPKEQACEAEAAAGPHPVCRSKKLGASAASSASPCRRREASSCADGGAGMPKTAREFAVHLTADSSSTSFELPGLNRWVEDLHVLIDSHLETAQSDGCVSVAKRLDSPGQRKHAELRLCAGGPEAGAGAELTRSPSTKGSRAGQLAGGAASSPSKGGQETAKKGFALWTTSASSPKRGNLQPSRPVPQGLHLASSDVPSEAEAAAGSLSNSPAKAPAAGRSQHPSAEPPECSGYADRSNATLVESQLEDILREFDEIDRIHLNVCKLSSQC